MTTITVKQTHYEGEVSRAPLKRCGQGTYTYSDDFHYAGSWDENGEKHGNGIFTVRGHSVYTGNFSNGEITGSGVIEWCDGKRYSGEFLRGEMHGQGVWTDPKICASYQGGFCRNQRSGYGELKTASLQYTGQFERNNFQGQGELTVQALTYRGDFSAGNLNGEGEVHDASQGSVYRGGFLDGKKSGQGCLYFTISRLTLRGDWEDDVSTASPARILIATGSEKLSAVLADPKRKAVLANKWIPEDSADVPVISIDAGAEFPTLSLKLVTSEGADVPGESGRVFELRILDKLADFCCEIKIGVKTRLNGSFVSLAPFRRVVSFGGKGVIDGLFLPQGTLKGFYLLEVSDVTLNIPSLLPKSYLGLLVN